jgi:hypothetical protein
MLPLVDIHTRGSVARHLQELADRGHITFCRNMRLHRVDPRYYTRCEWDFADKILDTRYEPA